jgi:hypothetical protein
VPRRPPICTAVASGSLALGRRPAAGFASGQPAAARLCAAAASGYRLGMAGRENRVPDFDDCSPNLNPRGRDCVGRRLAGGFDDRGDDRRSTGRGPSGRKRVSPARALKGLSVELSQRSLVRPMLVCHPLPAEARCPPVPSSPRRLGSGAVHDSSSLAVVGAFAVRPFVTARPGRRRSPVRENCAETGR